MPGKNIGHVCGSDCYQLRRQIFLTNTLSNPDKQSKRGLKNGNDCQKFITSCTSTILF
jgi:hypothetical protein